MAATTSFSCAANSAAGRRDPYKTRRLFANPCYILARFNLGRAAESDALIFMRSRIEETRLPPICSNFVAIMASDPKRLLVEARAALSRALK